MKRRQFLLLSGASAGFLALDTLGCRMLTGSYTIPEPLPGLESHTATTCLMCPGGCGLKIRSVDGSAVGIAGNPNHPVNAGGVCTEGLSALQLLYHPDRLRQPMRRKDGKRSNPFEELNWDGALEEIGKALSRLQGAGAPQKLAFVLGRSGGSMEELVRHFMSRFGSPNLHLDVPRDGYAEVFEIMHGLRVQPAFDFDNADIIFSFGADLLNAWTSPLQYQRSYASSQSEARGSRAALYVADSHLSTTAARAKEWVGIAPGSYGSLALGIAYVMLRERLYDSDFVNKYLHGFDDFPDGTGNNSSGYRSMVLREYSPEEASRQTGVPVERILELGKAFGEAPRALALFDENVFSQPGGVYAAMAVHSLNLLKGNLNRPGGIYLQPPVPLTPIAAPRQQGTGAGRDLVVEDLLDLVSKQPVDVLFLYYSNPVYSSPFGSQLQAALDKIPLIISFSPFFDESSRFVDFMLPDRLPLERWEDRIFPSTSPISGWGIVQPAVQAPAGVRHSGEVMLELARRVGPPLAEAFPWQSFEELLKHRTRGIYEEKTGTTLVDSFSQGLVAEMESRGWSMANFASFDEFWQRLLETGGWTDPNFQVMVMRDYSGHPDGKIDLSSRTLRKRLALPSGPMLDMACLPHHSTIDERSRIHQEFPMVLNPSRWGKLGGGTNGSLPWVLQQAGAVQNTAWTSWAEISPQDAEKHGIKNQDWMWVESAAGKVRVRAAIYLGAGPGVVNMPSGFGHEGMGRWAEERGVNPLSILAANRDPISELPYRLGTRVKIYKA